MTISRRAKISLVSLMIGVFVAWFAWKSFERDKTVWLENKAEAALSNSASQTSIIGQATVEFPLWAGIEKQIVIHSTIHVLHYPSSN